MSGNQGGREQCVGGRYRLVEPLGRGGMGSVWRAFDERLHRTVAVKIVDPAQSHADQGRAEALALAQLNHPHVANVFDYGEDDGRPYLVMELVRGQSLATILAGGPLGWRAAAAAVAQVASALAAAHARGLVHRDVKPGNIMLTPAGAKLIDFGICAVEGEAEVDADGGLRGTPVYVAPERLRGRAVAAPADVYALGVVLYLALSGRLPSEASDIGEQRTEREHGDPMPLPPVDGLPPDVADICLQCLAADPARRPDAATVARLLTEAAGPDGVRELNLLAASRDGVGDPTQLMAPVSIADPRPGRRFITARVGAAAAAVAAALAVAWSTAQWGPASDDGLPDAINAVAAVPAQPACEVAFTLAADDGRRFAAEIVATPRTGSFRPGWRLSLPLQSGMEVDQASGWTRKGPVIVSPAQPSLGSGHPVQLALSGSHTGAIALPARMSADGRDCIIDTSVAIDGGSTSVSDDDRAPSQPAPDPKPMQPQPANRPGGGQAGNGPPRGAGGPPWSEAPLPDSDDDNDDSGEDTDEDDAEDSPG